MNGPHCNIVPPYLLRTLAGDADPVVAASAGNTLEQDNRFRMTRERPRPAPSGERRSYAARAVEARAQRAVSDAQNTEELPGQLVRSNDVAATGDAAVDEAWDGFGATWQLFHDAFKRDSIDGAGMLLEGTVHFGQAYDNAFWDGERMVFGDGDGEIFGRFTASPDVIGHELAHGVTERTANLAYRGQPGALNEHISDVFGALVKQWSLGQTADQADWLIGAELLLPDVAGTALRNMLHPGTAYDDPRLGRDPQPDHLDRFVVTEDDFGGVHVNSGIPNRAFAVAATTRGGKAWQGVGQVWYDVLTGPELRPQATFAAFAGLTVAAAVARFGDGSPEQAAILAGWQAVGVQPGVEGSTKPASYPDPPDQTAAELLLRRTGGVTGVVKERRTTLDALPDDDAERWKALLAADILDALARHATSRVDSFCYEVACVAYSVDVTVTETQLSRSQRLLFQRTLRGA